MWDVTSNILSAEANRNTMTVSIEALETATVPELRNAVVRALQEIGYDASYVDITAGAATDPTWTGHGHGDEKWQHGLLQRGD